MPRFHVPEMSCGHCTAEIEKAVREADARASVDCNLDDRSVTVQSSLSIEALQGLLKTAGYEARTV